MGKKIYCYVDETGQDTKGEIYIVSIVVPQNRDETLEYVEKIELESGKGKLKWGKADEKKRLSFLKIILEQKKHPLKFFYSVYRNTTEYKQSTILTIAKTINCLPDYENRLFVILVDGLSEKDQRYFGAQLRHLRIHTKKVRGIKKDENDALIRLADSVCGFVRDARESHKNDAIRQLYNKFTENRTLKEV